jgi:hypothetical protein
LKADRFRIDLCYFLLRIIDLNTIYENLTCWRWNRNAKKVFHLELEKNIVEIANDFNSAYEKNTSIWIWLCFIRYTCLMAMV